MKKEAATLMAMRFAELYSKTGNATRAAKEAGYSEKSAYSQGSRLLKRSDVQEYLRAARIDRTVLANQTFIEIVEGKDRALKFVQAMETGGDPEDRARAMAVLFKYHELMARMGGLFFDHAPVDAGEREQMLATMQELVKRIPAYTPARVIDAPPALEAPKNGNGHSNGHSNGNGNSWHTLEEGGE